MRSEMAGRWMVATMLGLGLALGGCGGGLGGGSGTTTDTVQNEGAVCLKKSGDGQGESEVRVKVHFNACLSSSCDTLVDKGCSVEVSSGELTVESEATIESEKNPQGCTADCGLVSANCGTVTLEDGEYSLTHGDESMQFSTPLDSETCGAGESPGVPQ